MNFFKKNYNLLCVLIITFSLLILMLAEHNWNNQPVIKLEKPLSPSILLPDFSQFDSVKDKKQAFFDYLRPIIRQENQKIQYDRMMLEKIIEDLDQVPQHQSAALRKLEKLAKKYRVTETRTEIVIAKLNKKIGKIPESLVLAQAANESAWGTSRFARSANNLFGQWCFKKGCGIVPKGREKGEKHEIRRFNRPQDSVASYMRNLNSHPAYTDLRQIRENLRSRGKAVLGSQLAHGLLNYSQKRETYVLELVDMIRQNKLE